MNHNSARTVLLLAIGCGLAVTGYSQSFVTNGLVAYYPFNGNANDASGNGINGTVYGASLSPDRFGLQSSAYYFSGTSYIDFGTNLHLGQPHAGFTITLWFKASGLGPIFGDYEGTATGGDDVFATEFMVDNNQQHSSLPNYLSIASRSYPAHPLDYTLYVGDKVVIDQNWHSVVYVMDGVGVCRAYFEGQQKATLPYDASLNYVQGSHWQAGRVLFSGQWQYFTGYVDDIRVYSRSLSAAEVQQLYIYESGPRLNLIKAVKPAFNNLTLTTSYQLQVSADMEIWTNQGTPFTATNTSMVYPQYWDVDDWNSLYFRLQVVP